MRIVYNFASRSRVDKFFKVLDNVTSLAKHYDYEIVCTCDLDDEIMFNQTVVDRISSYDKVRVLFGTSKNKIDAINKNLGLLGEWDILFNISDDQLFLMDGFDLEVIKDFEEHFPDLDGFIHYPDTQVKHLLPTMSIMGRKYFDRFGYVYHSDYESVWADNEALSVAQELAKYTFIDKQIFDHYHPAFGRAEKDEQYLKTEHPAVYLKDKQTYDRRKENNFYL